MLYFSESILKFRELYPAEYQASFHDA
jgi:hypothetical protein